MDRIRLRELQRGEFRNPTNFLIALRGLESTFASSTLDPRVKHLRTNGLREWREAREAALFCFGLAQRIGHPIFLRRGESQDYDFVASWVDGDEQHFAPVQLKEVVPESLNPNSGVEQIIQSLIKYVDSEDLMVAIHLNRQVHFDPRTLVVPPLRIAALWVFASVSPDQSEWGLWGNFLEQSEGSREGSRFTYPS